MKLAVSLFIFFSLLIACDDNKLPSEEISKITVVRETSSSNKITQTSLTKVDTVITTAIAPTPTPIFQKSKTRYHIIVASFGAKEKSSAQKLVAELKAKNYPASILYSSGRSRVSIENYPTEIEANTARDKHRKTIQRKDCWVHKVE